MKESRRFELSAAALHIMAMAFMLLDHMWATILSYDWMTCVGRLAFPIFAFMIAEGVKHTGNMKKYMLRMLIFAVISELPFNLMVSGELFFPLHQNVLWTFLIALSGLWLVEKVKKKQKLWLTIPVWLAVAALGTVLGFILFVDYYGCGVLMVFVFCIFDREKADNPILRFIKNERARKIVWTLICLAGQLISLYLINVEMLGGLYYSINILGFNIRVFQQGLALFALIPIWLYRGKQGYHAKWFKYFNYAFYPVHCLILGLIAMI